VRYRNRECNVQDCNGDEICIAKQDLIIAIDGSGSLRAKGFKTLTDWVGVLLKRYTVEYWGENTVKLGIVLFGNGVIMPDGMTVSPAINAHALSFDMDSVKQAVSDLPFKKGFTNMAQAFAMAEDMFIKGSRRKAQQSVMVVTDGKPSFSFMTNEMVEQLDDKSIMRYFVVVSETPLNDDSMNNMKKWASHPWETNLIHVQGGLVMLEADEELWAEKAVTKFCPLAHSPMADEFESKSHGMMQVYSGGYCGEKKKKNLLSKNVDGSAQCAALASGAQVQSFLLGKGLRKGWCFAGTMEVSDRQFDEWVMNKVTPTCPEEGGWIETQLFDFFVLEPVAKEE